MTTECEVRVKCCICKKEKPISEFPIRNKQKGIYQRFCKICKRPYARAWYERHKSEQLPKISKNRKKRTESNQKWIREIRSKPCHDCGNTFHWFFMEFDHRSNKAHNISRMPGRFSRDHIQKEIDKCDVVCVMCHRKRTWNRMNKKKKSLAT